MRARLRWTIGTLFAASCLGPLAACDGCSGAASDAAEAVTPDDFCAALFDGLVPALEARCAAEPAASEARRYLVELALDRRARCRAMVGPAHAAGTAVLHGEVARRCGATLAAASWKDTLDARDASLLFETCRGLVTGRVAPGGACRSSLECADGQSCRAVEGNRVCGPALGDGASCLAGRPVFGHDAHPDCAAGLACVGDAVDLALDHPLGVSLGELGERELALAFALGWVRPGLPAGTAAVGLDALGGPRATRPPRGPVLERPSAACTPVPALGAASAPCGALGCAPGLFCDRAVAEPTCRARKPAGAPCGGSPECAGRCDLASQKCVAFCEAG